jgi:hypothetical protein
MASLCYFSTGQGGWRDGLTELMVVEMVLAYCKSSLMQLLGAGVRRRLLVMFCLTDMMVILVGVLAL